jgi:hypothetical protein
MKQETLEEAAEKYANELPEPYNYGINSDKKKGFIEGAKWQAERIGLMEIELNHTKTLLASCEKALENRDNQAERMYSEEDIINALHSVELKDNRNYSKIYVGMKEWLEQFKKK